MRTKILMPNSLPQTSLSKDFFLVAMGALLMTLSAPLSFKLPFTPIPVAVAPHMALLLGFTLGPKRGSLAVLGYLFEGILGMPVFALGASGIMHLLGPRGGYLMGYLLGAYITGVIAERSQKKSNFSTFLALMAGNGAIYLCGLAQLSLFIGLKSVFFLGCYPFLAGDVLKSIGAYMICQKVK